MKRILAALLIVCLMPAQASAAIVFANLGVSTAAGANTPDIANSNDTNSYASASWTPPTSGLIIVCVINRAVTDAQSTTPTITGNGITWTEIATQTNGLGPTRITLFGANAAGSSTGATTVAYSVNQRRALASFFHAEGVNLTGGTLAAFVQAPVAAGSSTTATVALSAAGNAANRPIACTQTHPDEDVVPRASWTEVDELTSDDPYMHTQFRSDAFETTASATFATSGVWQIIAAEIKASLSRARRKPVIFQ
jgi:hypothetical protein